MQNEKELDENIQDNIVLELVFDSRGYLFEEEPNFSQLQLPIDHSSTPELGIAINEDLREIPVIIQELNNSKSGQSSVIPSKNRNMDIEKDTLDVVHVPVATNENLHKIQSVNSDLNNSERNLHSFVNSGNLVVDTSPIEETTKELQVREKVVNTCNQQSEADKFPESYGKLLFWPKEDSQKKTSRVNTKTKFPSVLTCPKWQNIAQNKEEQKRKIEEDKISRKKIKQEKQEAAKIEKENSRILREQQKIIREEMKIQKAKEKFAKQQEKIMEMEARQYAKQKASREI